jgi:hypothetical protein
VVEEQIEVVVAARKCELDLPADECKAAAELQQEALDVIDQSLLDLALPPWVRGAEEVEEVRILEDLRRHVRIRKRQRGLEVGESLAVAFVGAAVDLQLEDASAPAVLDGLPDVPLADFGILHPLQEADDVAPGQL